MFKKLIISTITVFSLTGCSSSFFSMEDPWKVENRGEFTEEEKHFDRHKIIQAKSYSTPTRPFLRNSNWKVSHIDSKRINPTYLLTINFRNNIYNKHDFLVSGQAGCNSYQGHVSLEIMQGKLETDTLFRATRHHCEDANLIAIEKQFINAVFKNTNVEQNGENSIFLDYRDKRFTLQRL